MVHYKRPPKTLPKPWTADEVDFLCDMVAKDKHSFAEIAAHMPGRNRNQVGAMWRRIAMHYESRLAIRNRMNGF